MFHGIHHLSTTIISHTASSESSETQDKPSHIGSEERVSLETVTNSLVSVDGEHLSLLSPKDTSNVRGCIMNFFMHIEAEMRCSIRHSILKSKERIPLEFSASLMAEKEKSEIALSKLEIAIHKRYCSPWKSNPNFHCISLKSFNNCSSKIFCLFQFFKKTG